MIKQLAMIFIIMQFALGQQTQEAAPYSKIHGLENNFHGLKYNRDRVVTDLNYYSDGMNCKRISDIVLSLNNTNSS